MNITTASHFRQCFPEEDSTKYDTYYFSKATDTEFVFVAVKGKLEDVKIFQRGHYNDDSLERLIFSIIARYSARTSSDSASLYDDSLDEQEVRVDLIAPSRQINHVLMGVMWWSLLIMIEIAGIVAGILVGLRREHLLVIVASLMIVNMVIVIFYRKSATGKDDRK